jgi:hypothetical protein
MPVDCVKQCWKVNRWWLILGLFLFEFKEKILDVDGWNHYAYFYLVLKGKRV